MVQQDMCPICTKQFKDGDVIIEYRVWENNNKSQIGARPLRDDSRNPRKVFEAKVGHCDF